MAFGNKKEKELVSNIKEYKLRALYGSLLNPYSDSEEFAQHFIKNVEIYLRVKMY